MSGYKNSRKERFLDGCIQASIDLPTDDLATRCKFNFSYFEKQAGQAFAELSHEQLVKLLEKLRDYSRQSLKHWRQQSIGSSGAVLAVYGKFPAKSAFCHPKHVPHQAQWARFRLESAVRLVGFIVPNEYDGREQNTAGERFDCNTFYVVFLDANHEFYQSEKR